MADYNQVVIGCITFSANHDKLEAPIKELVSLRARGKQPNRFVAWSEPMNNYTYWFGNEASNVMVKRDLLALFPEFKPAFSCNNGQEIADNNEQEIADYNDDGSLLYPVIGHTWIIRFANIPETVTVRFT